MSGLKEALSCITWPRSGHTRFLPQRSLYADGREYPWALWLGGALPPVHPGWLTCLAKWRSTPASPPPAYVALSALQRQGIWNITTAEEVQWDRDIAPRNFKFDHIESDILILTPCPLGLPATKHTLHRWGVSLGKGEPVPEVLDSDSDALGFVY